MGRLRGTSDPPELADPLRSIVEGTAANTGEAFFRSLVRHLAAALEVRYVFVGEVRGVQRDTVGTLAVWAGDDFDDNFEYPLAGTPCENVVRQTMCFYPGGVQRLFPQDVLLAKMGAESYLGTPIFGASGDPLGLLCVLDPLPMQESPQARDLLAIFASRAGAELERERAEEAVRQSEERTRLIIDRALDAVITIDAAGLITDWNARAEAIFGWERYEALGQSLSDLIIPPRYRGAHERGLKRFLLKGEGPILNRRVEMTALRRNGAEFPVELSIAAFRTRDTFEFSGFLRDLTSARQAEEERRRLEDHIQHAQKLESLGVLAGGIAHDFNNLLTGILANAGAARRQVLRDSFVARALDEIAQASKVASRLTGQLLAYAGKGRLDVQALDLTDEVRMLEPLLESSVRDRASLVLDLEPDLPAIEADPVQIQQILMNLAINAAESSQLGGHVRLTTRALDVAPSDLSGLVPGSALRAGPCVALDVEDEGCGMDAATRERIFEPFFSTKATGRGLGLAAVLGIVRSHRGGVRLESTPGVGTRFGLLFPVSERSVERAAAQVSVDLHGQGSVLIVDDDEYVLQALYYGLSGYGYSVILADGGTRAVELFRARAGEVDLVVLDLMMPGMGGDETLRELRAIRPDVRVLISTGYGEDEAARRLASQGVEGFLRKPYDPEELAAEVKRLMETGGTTEPVDDTSRVMESLRASYRQRLPDKLRELETRLRDARGGGSAERREQARLLAHTLKGTAGSYGFVDVASELEFIESVLDELPADQAADAASWSRIEEALSRARSCLE
jgi:PAS domain S-box-containing protein